MSAKLGIKVISVLFVSLFIASCGPGQLFGPTPTPTPIVPKAGTWRGEDTEGNHFPVFITTTNEGEIRITQIGIIQKLDNGNCSLFGPVSGVVITVNADGTFYYSDEVNEEGFRGKFDDTETVHGTATQHYCIEGGQLFNSSNNYDINWTAKLVSEEPTATPHSPAQENLLASIRSQGKIMVIRDNKYYSMNPDGSDLRVLTDYLKGEEWEFDCSPDGKQIVSLKSSGELFIANADLTNKTELSVFGYTPTWSPDGHKILYASGGVDGGNIFVVNPDGTGEAKLTTSDVFNYQLPVWTSDGRIAFKSKSEQAQYYIMNGDGSNLSEITEEMYTDFAKEWSPDRTAYLVNLYPDPGIEIFKTDGSASVVIETGGYSPRWCP